MIQTIGVIGGGQLGRMLTLDAKRMGYDVITLDPQPHSPCGQVADEQIVAKYDDFDAIDDLGRRTDVVTYEFENIAIESVQRLEQDGFDVTPGSDVLRIAQNRLLEKGFAQTCGIPVAPFAEVNNAADLDRACANAGFPAVIKTVRGGYDGKGQWRAADARQAHEALEQAKGAQLIYEQFVPFACEISVVCTRNAAGEIVTYPASENIHDRGILYMSIVPARVDEEIARRAAMYAEKIAAALQIAGTFCVEFFVTHEGQVLVNEIAPRPHNSGHYTIDATRCSQYEQHVRAICGLPLSEPELLRNAVMINILGEGTGNHLAGVDDLLRDPSIVLHMYGKKHAVDRRKMGHFTMLIHGPITDSVIERARAARSLLHWTDTPKHAAAGR
ncbi:MAG TPA: 5-(carboxyamino)imidazole ribonucleotide synthase [Candidatus Baltobacteraceae bacterium]|nr:5-(carboxyamino)imidazole ribonucleotide synthase [Candidatus Baltobacteraceae bacterium]